MTVESLAHLTAVQPKFSTYVQLEGFIFPTASKSRAELTTEILLTPPVMAVEFK